jgi:hypothetical protein
MRLENNFYNSMKTPNIPSSSLTSSLPLFVYGTLISPIVMESVIQRKSVGRPARLLPSSSSRSETATTNESCKLYNYSRHPVRGQVYPGLVHWNITSEPFRSEFLWGKKEGMEYVCGLLYSDLTDAELELLDTYESDQYNREQCHVKLFSTDVDDHSMVTTTALDRSTNQSIMAMVYVWANPLTELDLSKDWSYTTFEQEHLKNYI